MTNGEKTKISYLKDRRPNFPKSNKTTKKMKKPNGKNGYKLEQKHIKLQF